MEAAAASTIVRRARALPATLVAFVALLVGSAPGAAFAQCDSDGDGFDIDDATCLGDDCDDGDPQTYPGAPELCDGLDNDCDGLPGGDEGDGDGDGWMACEDCDDADPAVHPGAAEQCNAVDDDCDGQLGQEDVVSLPSPDQTFPGGYDLGRGGKFQATQSVALDSFEMLLDAPAGSMVTWVLLESSSENGWYTEVAATTTISPADGFSMRSSGWLGVPMTAGSWYVALTYYEQWTGWGWTSTVSLPWPGPFAVHVGGVQYGGATPPSDGGYPTTADRTWVLLRSAGEDDADGDGFLACDDDCDDGAPQVHPGAAEVCDGLDDDCDGLVPPDEVDGDADGFAACEGDCDDAEPAAFPGNPELCDFGLDNDCDPATDENFDSDGDGFTACDAPGDCVEGDPATYPGAPELCDWLDNDCDGSLPPGRAGRGWRRMGRLRWRLRRR